MIALTFRLTLQRPAGFVALALTLLAGTVPAPAAIAPAENLLPADTLMVITVPDFARVRDAARQSPQWLLWNDPAMKPFRNDFLAKWNERFVAPLEQELGIKLQDYTDLPQGQLTFAITQNGWTGADDSAPGVLLLLDARGKSDLLQTNLAALRRKWTDAGKPVRTETIRGIPFSVVTISSNEVPPALARFLPHRPPVSELGREEKASPPAQIVVGQYQSLLIVGNSVKAVGPVAARVTGGALPPLADNAQFAADRLAHFRNAPLYYGWLNAKTLFTVLAHIPQPEPNPDAPSPVPPMPWDHILTASGLAGLKSVSFSYRDTHEGADLDCYFAVPEADRQGIFKIVGAAAPDAAPPAFVPADTVKFWRWRGDGRKAWATLRDMMDEISPGALQGLNSIISLANATAQQKDPAFDINKYLFDNLGDDWMDFQKAPAGKSAADLKSPPSLFLFAALDPDKAIMAIKSVASLGFTSGNAPPPRQFLGRTIYTITMPSASAAPLYCTTSSGYVALTTDVSMIEAFLRSADSRSRPLRDTAGFAAAAQHVGGADHGFFNYDNQRDSMRTVFSALKANPPVPAKPGPLGPLAFAQPGKLFANWMDFSLLPDYDRISKYFYFSVGAGNFTADGLSFRFFAPRPPELP